MQELIGDTMEDTSPNAKISPEFFAKLMVGQTICGISRDQSGVFIEMESGVRARIAKSYSADIPKEKITEFSFQFPNNHNRITLHFASGKTATILI